MTIHRRPVSACSACVFMSSSHLVFGDWPLVWSTGSKSLSSPTLNVDTGMKMKLYFWHPQHVQSIASQPRKPVINLKVL